MPPPRNLKLSSSEDIRCLQKVQRGGEKSTERSTCTSDISLCYTIVHNYCTEKTVEGLQNGIAMEAMGAARLWQVGGRQPSTNTFLLDTIGQKRRRAWVPQR